MSSFKPAARVSRPPIRNPYDKFSKPDFEDWIGSLTGSLRHALGRDQPSSAASTQTQSRTGNHDSISNVGGRLSPEVGQEADSLSDNGFGYSREQRRDDLGRQSSVLSTGDDPSQPIELDLDSEEDERDDPAIYEEIDEEDDYSGSQDDELHEDAQVHVNGFTTHEYDMENDSEEHDEAETVIPHHSFDAPARETQPVPSDDEPEITVIEDDEDENYESENEEDDANAVELPDVWEGPEEYAEDYYAGGDGPATGIHRPASPSHLEDLSDPEVSDEGLPEGDYVSGDELEDDIEEIDDPAGEDLPIQPDNGPTPQLVDPWLGPAQYAEDFYSGGDAPLRRVSTLVDPSSIEATPQEHETFGFSSGAFNLPGQRRTDGAMHAQPDEILDVDAEDWSTIQEEHGKIPDLYHDGLSVQGEFVTEHDDIPVYGGSELVSQYSENTRESIAGMPPSNPDLLTGGVSSFASDPTDKAELDALQMSETSKDVDMAKNPNVEETIAHEMQEQIAHAEPLGTTEAVSNPPVLPLDPILAGEGKEPPTPLDAEALPGPAEQDISLEPDAFSIDVGSEPRSIPQHTEPGSASSLPNPSGITRARRPTLRDQMPEINPNQPPLSDTPNLLPTPLMMAIPQARLDDLLTSVRRGDLNAATDYFPSTPGLSTDQPAWPTDLPNEPALDGAASTFMQPVEELLDFIVANNIEAFDQPAESTGGGHFGYDYAVEEVVAIEKTSVEGDIDVRSIDSNHIVNENSTPYEVKERTTTEPHSPIMEDTDIGISITVESAEEPVQTSPQPKAQRPTFIRMPSSTLASATTSMKTTIPSDLQAVHQHQVLGTPSILLLSHPPTPGTPPPLSVPVTPRALEELQARQAGAVPSTSHEYPSKDHKDSTEEPITSEQSAPIELASTSSEEGKSSNLVDAKEETASDASSHSAEDDIENTKGSSVESGNAKAGREGPQIQQPESESAVVEQELEQAVSAEAKITSLGESVDPFTLMGTDSKVAPREVDDDATPVGELERESATPDTEPDGSLSTHTITLKNATDETESASPQADKTVSDTVEHSQEAVPTRKRKRSAMPSSTRVLRSISTLGRKGKGKQNVIEDDASSQASSVHTASSGSSTNAVANMLSIGTRGSDSRASSVVSDATSASSFIPIPSPTDSRHHLLPEPVHDSVHHHHHHHQHNQPVRPPPSKSNDQVEAAVPVPPPSKPPSTVQSRAASPAPSTSSVSSTAPKPRKPRPEAVVTESPVTRSNCRFHKISIPRSEGGRRINFSVPGCALGNMELMKDEDIQDHGVVPPDEFRRRQNNLDAFRLPVPLVAIIHQLVGIELQRQGEIFYLPDEVELQQARHRLARDLKKARNSPVKLSQARRLTASALSRRETATLSAGPSMSPQTSASASISSIGRSPSKARERKHLPPGPMSSISDDEGLTELEEEEEGEEEKSEEPKPKRQKRKTNTGESMLSASVGPASSTSALETVLTSKTRRGRKLASDAAAYQPDEDGSDESTGEDVSVKRKGRKRGRTSIKGDHDDGESSRRTKKMRERTAADTSTQDETIAAAAAAAEDI